MSDEKTPSTDDQPHKILDEEEAPKTQLEVEQNAAATELSSPTKKASQLSMDIKVYSPFKNYYEGEAFSVSAENLTGPFDILPGHHNFITLLSVCQLVVRADKGEQKIDISGGIMHVKANKVIVFLDV